MNEITIQMNEFSMARSRPGPAPRAGESDIPEFPSFVADGDTPLGVPLSRPEVDLLGLLADGLPLAVVAREVHASERTVRRRLRAICDRLGFTAPIQAVAWAARRGLV
jgi:DNA-binding NarL/FixJ family response regulator